MNRRLLAYLFLAVTLTAIHVNCGAIVIRHDVDESRHLEPEPGPAYLIDLPHEGHAVLISRRWLVTVAHTIFYDYSGLELSIGGDTFTISRVVIHPDYQDVPAGMLEGDSKPLMRFLADRSDIALIELTEPVSGAAPIAIYRGGSELGMRVQVYGRGSTGTGKTGEIAATKPDRTLRHCENIVSRASERWLAYEFDEPDTALPLEGIHGSGDSGGASIAVVDGQHYLVGLSSWQYYEGDLEHFRGGLYGVVGFQTRISKYAKWIDSYISGAHDGSDATVGR